MNKFLLAIACLVCLILTAVPACAQGERGAITGIVKDPTGAVVPAAKVVAAHLQTNVESSATTTAAGLYRIPYLPPGNYKVTVTASGFKQAVISPVAVTIAGVVTADFTLEVGSLSESISVSAEATLLESSTAEVGRGISAQEYHTWPLIVGDGQRQLQAFIFKALPGAVGEEWSGSLNGGQTFAHEILIEGMSLGRFDLQGGANSEFSPSADAVSEFKLQTGALGAQYGGTQTSVANFNIRSGGNQFHGTLYEYLRNDKFDAVPFANNAVPLSAAMPKRKPPFRLNNFGVTSGGPIWLPSLYNGRNKTFYFFTYEGTRQRNYRFGSLITLPTPEMKRGDFSRVLDPAFTGDRRSGTVIGTDTAGRPVVFGAIYDPRSTRQVGGQYVRDVFPNNIIPQTAFSKVSKNILEMAPIPDPMFPTFQRNYPSLGTCCPVFSLDTFGGKLDHTFNQAHRMAFFVNRSNRDRFNSTSGRYLPAPGSATSAFARQIVSGILVRVTEDWVISPRWLNHIGLGYNRLLNSNNTISLDQDWPQKIGLQNVPGTHFPRLRFTDGNTVQGRGIGANGYFGRNTAGVGANGSTIFVNDTSFISGRHSIKFGVEIRKYYYNTRERGNTTGTFRFGPDQTAHPSFRTQTGFSFASFLLGAVRQAGRSVITTSPGYRAWYPALYVSDDFKATPKLTLNLGLRWEIVGAFYEVADRMSGLDLTKPNPEADNYPGALVFAKDLGRRSFQDPYYKEFGPRIGAAYQLHPRVVLRGGYGVNYSAPINNGWGYGNTYGYDSSINLPTSTRDPAFWWDTPFPSFRGTLPDKNPSLQNGADISYTARDSTKQPYVHNWSLGVQWLLPSQTVIETSYIGNVGRRLLNYSMSPFQQLPLQYMSLGDKLNDDIGDHPEIKKPYPSFENTVAYALRPLPQYDGAYDQFPHVGSSRYDSFQLQATRRMSKGLSLLIGYTWSKALTDSDSALEGAYATIQDAYHPALEKSVASFNYPHFLKATWIWELPFGKGRRFLDRGGVANAVLGNWTLTGIHNYRSGNPLSIWTSIDTSTTLFNGGIRGDVLSTSYKQDAGGLAYGSGTQYLNPSAFASPPTTPGGVPLRLGYSSRYVDGLRGERFSSEDFGLFKRFPIKEEFAVEFRCDFFNFLNRAGRGDPITNVNDAGFGKITGPAYGPRTVQFELRINY
jgi:hypothetical protein